MVPEATPESAADGWRVDVGARSASIVDVRPRRLTAPLHTSFVTALRSTTRLETLLVEVVDSDGASGFGEAPQVWQVTGASLAGSEACVAEILRPLLLGRDPDDVAANGRAVARAVVGNESAKAAVDVALLDLAARRLGVPLVRLLGGVTLRVPTDVTLPAGEPESLARAGTERAAEGFTVLKVKVGTDAATDVARVMAVREAVGPAVRIRADANQGWTAKEAVRVITALERAGADLEFVEQPVAAWDLDGLRWVTDRVDTPVMADESVFSLRDLTEVVRRRAADLVNVKLAKCGGLGPARTLLAVAAEHGLGTMIGSMMEGPVGVGAAASLAAATGTTAVSDLDAAWWLRESPPAGGLRYDGGTVTLPEGPGLGRSRVPR
jgi:L-alanine-DL-glutamate epimerase-like enolase superfamily enzyme